MEFFAKIVNGFEVVFDETLRVSQICYVTVRGGPETITTDR